MAELLNISNDSAYWRLRRETSLTFDEISILCNHYNISFNAFNITEQTSVVSFKGQKMVGSDRKFKSYFEDLCGSIARVSNSSEKDKPVLYAGQGLPMFYYFKHPILALFKIFHWHTTGRNLTTSKILFDQYDRDEELLAIGKRIFDQNLKIPCTEIWSDSIVLGTIHQIQFYWDAGMFSSTSLALAVCEEFRLLLEYVQHVCTTGRKSDDV